MTYFLRDKNGNIQWKDEQPHEGWESTEETIIEGYNGKYVLESETRTAEYLKAEKEYLKFFANEEKIVQLKQKLKETDYQSLKHAEGEMTEEEFESIKQQRKNWRAEINKLEDENKTMEV